LSQGALFKHFPNKSELLAATAAHLYDGLIDRYVSRFHRLERKDESARIDAAVKLLWQLFESAEWGAGIELVTAARTDPDLRDDLEPVVAHTAARVREVAAGLWPDAVDRPDYDRTIDLVLELMQGMAVSRFVDPTPAHYRRLLDHITELARTTLSSDGDRTEPR
jgi:AcrR family transcriptional regulator